MIDDGPSHPKCKVEDVPPTTPPKVKKSRELMWADEGKSGKGKGKGKVREVDVGVAQLTRRAARGISKQHIIYLSLRMS